MKTKNIPKKADERRAWIKYQLELIGYSFAGLAREHGLSRTCVLSALYRPYPKMERIIAKKLGVRPPDLWPERYFPGFDDTNRGGKKQ
jgi:Ner family transcriptional regulator